MRKRRMLVKVKSLTEFHEGAPGNATHVLKLDDKYEYANFDGLHYNSCDNSTTSGMLSSSLPANSDWFFNVSKYDWQVHLVLNNVRR